jgi:hypothetical protein
VAFTAIVINYVAVLDGNKNRIYHLYDVDLKIAQVAASN